jgi:hypothetical protein
LLAAYFQSDGANWSAVPPGLTIPHIPCRLFEIAPNAKGLFAFDDEAPLDTDPTMRLHATEVLKTVGIQTAFFFLLYFFFLLI